MDKKEFIDCIDVDLIEECIKKAELLTSGEIRVHIEHTCSEDVLDRALRVFQILEMDSTELGNGVLLYFAVDDRKLAIIGDTGINAVVPDNFWEEIKQGLKASFSQEAYMSGLQKAIIEVGEQLKHFFPRASNDIDELTNEVSYNDNKTV